jgi:hypothetical protein
MDDKMHKGMAKTYKIFVNNRIGNLFSSDIFLFLQPASLQTKERRTNLPHLLYQHLPNHLLDVHWHPGGLIGQDRLSYREKPA